MGRGIKRGIFKSLIIGVILVMIYYPGYRKLKEAKYRQIQLEKRIAELRKENEELQKRLERLQNDMVYIEKLAREDLGIVGEGEIIYEFVPSEERSRGGAAR